MSENLSKIIYRHSAKSITNPTGRDIKKHNLPLSMCNAYEIQLKNIKH